MGFAVVAGELTENHNFLTYGDLVFSGEFLAVKVVATENFQVAGAIGDDVGGIAVRGANFGNLFDGALYIHFGVEALAGGDQFDSFGRGVSGFGGVADVNGINGIGVNGLIATFSIEGEFGDLCVVRVGYGKFVNSACGLVSSGNGECEVGIFGVEFYSFANIFTVGRELYCYFGGSIGTCVENDVFAGGG